MWTTHHCRCCKDKRYKFKPIGIKKRSDEQIYNGVKNYIENLDSIPGRRVHHKGFFWAEEIAKHLKVRTHLVKQALHKLNLEGLVTRPEHRIPHDSSRDPWNGGGHTAWMGDVYYLVKKETENG